MSAYRFYRLDGAGKITSADWVTADDDEQALAHARKASGGRFELWEGRRLVSREGEPKA